MSLPFRSTSSNVALPSYTYGWSRSSSLKSTYRHGYDGDDLKGHKHTTQAKVTRFLHQNWIPISITLIFLIVIICIRSQEPTIKADTGNDGPANDANIDLSQFDDSQSLPMNPDLFNHNYPAFMTSMKLSNAQKRKVWNSRCKAVARAFSHAWEGYVNNAWGQDELNPISNKGEDRMGFGLATVDSLDTAWLINKTIYERSYNWITKEQGLSNQKVQEVNVFETTVRVLGGLLSTYHLTKDVALLKVAVKVGDRLMAAFDESPKGIPWNSINYQTGLVWGDHLFILLFSSNSWLYTNSKRTSDYEYIPTAGPTSVQLEFKYLTHITSDPRYWNAVQNVSKILFQSPHDKTKPYDHLTPKRINISQPEFLDEDFRLSGGAGKSYECLGKQSLQTKGDESFFLKQYRASLKGIRKNLLMRSEPSNLLYVREIVGTFSKGIKTDAFDHTSCSLAATLALTATRGLRVPLHASGRKRIMNSQEMEELYIAEELAKTCFEMYHQTATGLAPETVVFNSPKDTIRASKAVERTLAKFKNVHKRFGHSAVAAPVALETVKEIGDHKVNVDFSMPESHSFSLLRPEAVETFLILFRVTGDEKYREWGWRLFRAVEQWAKVPSGGYAGLVSVIILS
ncbi:UNVERIFIED_CONTAM: hypothetical protein HDU68_012025 [Siphonaria sp. JEL0065]|nr:hypothetical protein HDU68_012025 [Siphonaria sp. JEL0065]